MQAESPRSAAAKRSAEEAGLPALAAPSDRAGRSAVAPASGDGDGTESWTMEAVGGDPEAPAAPDSGAPPAPVPQGSGGGMAPPETLQVSEVIKQLSAIIEQLYARALKLQHDSFNMFAELAKIQAMYNEWVHSVLSEETTASGVADAMHAAGSGSIAAIGSGSVASALAASIPGPAITLGQLADANALLAQHAASPPAPTAAPPSSQPSWEKNVALVADLMKIVRSGAAAAPVPPLSSGELDATLSAMQRAQHAHMTSQMGWGGPASSGFAQVAPPTASPAGARTVTTGGPGAFRSVAQQPGRQEMHVPMVLAGAMALPMTGGAAGISLAAASAMLNNPSVLAALPTAMDSLSPEAAAMLLSLLSGGGQGGAAPQGTQRSGK